jgi:ATP-dependent helicase/nuclease subunit A
MSITLTEEQQAVVENRGGGLLVSAAAGSGKTRVLVERLMRRITGEGEDLDHFLIITYTKAAAAELRGKIIDALNEEIAAHPGDRHLRRQSALAYRAQISTIHSFCQMVLRENGHLIDLDPDFRLGEDNECAVIKQRVLERLMEEHYQTVEEGDSFSLLLDTMSAGRDDRKLMDMVLDIHTKVQSHPDPAQWLEEQRQLFRLEGVTDVGDTPWGKLLLSDAKAQTDYWYGQMADLLNQLDGEGKLEEAYSPTLCDLMDGLDDFAAALDHGWDMAARRCQINYGRLNTPRSLDNPELAARVKGMKSRCKERMDGVTKWFQRSSSQLLDDLRYAGPAVIALLNLTQEFDEAYSAEKRRRRMVDFSDLEHLALKVLLNADGSFSDAAKLLSHRYTEVMVDEYQDTNQVQNAIFQAISRNGQTLFMVGDVKQSIYRFRLADPTIFLDRFERFPDHREAKEGESRKIVLSKNFRSRKSVLDGANFLFKALMSKEFGEIDYTPDHYLNPGLSYLEQPEDRVELNLVDHSTVETQEGEKKASDAQVEAEFVARRIRNLVEEKFPVTEGDHLRPVNWTDVVILYRSPGSVLAELTRALDAQNVPWQAEGGEDFFSTTEISVALSFLQIIDNPHQDVPLISVLRSPLYGFTPDQLAEIRAANRDADFYTALVSRGEAGDEPCQDFLAELEELRFRSADETASALLWEVYEETGMLAVMGAMEGGENRRSNLLLLYEYARQYEGTGHKGLFSFVTQLRRQLEAGRSITVSGTQGSGVRIMSIHKSKGLEFPVVVLAGLGRQFNRTDQRAAMLFHAGIGVGPKGMDPERGVQYPTLARLAVMRQMERELCAEELRLLYVAVTRAREKLILIDTVKDADKKLKKLTLNASYPMEPQALMAMNCMGDWVLSAAMTRPEGRTLWRDGEPLNHYLGADGAWNIRVVDGRKPERFLRRKKAAQAQTIETALPLDALYWKYPHQGAAEIPSKLTATQLKGRFQDEEAAEDTQVSRRPISFRVPDFTQQESPMTPAEAGTALHLFMQLCDPERASTFQGAQEELSRLVECGCMTERQANGCDSRKAARFFRSELGQQARQQGMEREFKFSMLTGGEAYYGQAAAGEQVLLQGVIDLWYTTLEGITVVDFKTDHVSKKKAPQRAEEYRAQLEVYTAALEQITGLTVAHRYLWFFHIDEAIELL